MFEYCSVDFLLGRPKAKRDVSYSFEKCWLGTAAWTSFWVDRRQSVTFRIVLMVCFASNWLGLGFRDMVEGYESDGPSAGGVAHPFGFANKALGLGFKGMGWAGLGWAGLG